jgi:hypothetical protein
MKMDEKLMQKLFSIEIFFLAAALAMTVKTKEQSDFLLNENLLIS